MNRIIGAQDSNRGIQKIGNSTAFARKFRIGTHSEVDTRPLPTCRLDGGNYQRLSRSRQYGAADHDPVEFFLRSQRVANNFATPRYAASIQATTMHSSCA